MKQLLFVYNPTAGRQRVRTMLSEILTVFAQEGYEITVRPTLGPGDATQVVADTAHRFDRVVCCGGDGTLNETVRGLLTLPQEGRPILGYIPAGTTNDFSRNINLPRSTQALARVACGGVPRAIDIGQLSDRQFLYIAAFGLFTDVSYSTPQASKNLLGHLAYVLEGAGRLMNFPSYPVKVTTDQGLEIEGEFLYGMVSNTVSIGGLVNLPRELVRLDDGQFEGLLIRSPKTAKDWQSILTALTTQKLPEDGSVVGFTCTQAHFTSPKPLAWTVDGEFGGEYTELDMSNRSRALIIACGN